MLPSQALKLEGYTPSSWDWKRGETVPYTETLHRYLEGRIPDGDKDDLTQMLSLKRVRQALSANPEYSGTFRIRVKEEIHNFQFNCVAYQVEGQTDPRVLLGFRNVDEIVRKEQQQRAALEDALHMAQAASEAKTAFLSSMSHDIRTPMNAIIGFLTLMRNEADNPEAVREYIQRIDSASQHLLGDKMRINQILINLLSNAVKYTREGGTIQLRVEELPQVVTDYSRIRFTVSDNGMGMSEEYLSDNTLCSNFGHGAFFACFQRNHGVVSCGHRG